MRQCPKCHCELPEGATCCWNGDCDFRLSAPNRRADPAGPAASSFKLDSLTRMRDVALQGLQIGQMKFRRSANGLIIVIALAWVAFLVAPGQAFLTGTQIIILVAIVGAGLLAYFSWVFGTALLVQVQINKEERHLRKLVADQLRQPVVPSLPMNLTVSEYLLLWFKTSLKEKFRVNPDQVHSGTSFTEDVGFDSLDFVEYVMAVEEEFGITVPDDQAEKIRTVGDAVQLVARLAKDLDKKDSYLLFKPAQPRSQTVGKIKILFLAANPVVTSVLQLDREARTIEEKLRGTKERDRLELVTKWALRPDDLQQYLLEHQPHVVHFSGHGTAGSELVLEDKNGRPHPLSQAALLALFSALKDNIRVVVLNACFSETQAKAITGLIDCAVGMNKAVGDEGAIVFAAAFYRALGFGRSVRTAFELGKAALLAENIPEENTPVLLTGTQVDPSALVLVRPSA